GAGAGGLAGPGAGPAVAIWTWIEDARPLAGQPSDRRFAAVPPKRSGGNDMADGAEVAEGFFDAWTGKDFDRARGLLHDDVSFAGPIDNFSDADSYLASLRQLSGIVQGADKQKVFVDGD